MSTLVLVLVLLTSGLIYRAVDRSLNDQVDEFLLDRVSSIAARLEDSPRGLFDTPGRRFRNPLGDVLIDARFDVSSQVITSTGEVVSSGSLANRCECTWCRFVAAARCKSHAAPVRSTKLCIASAFGCSAWESHWSSLPRQ
ncbi:MAG: hypothetical protein EBV14_04375 [Actinobacteria bacterium]|nr:hypothetical protein [Actinomycetota bacterium]